MTLKPLAERHHRLWRWFDSLEPGLHLPPQLESWGRGGAKSSTAEFGAVYVGCKETKRFCLYVCETQEAADKHVQTIAGLFERIGMERALSKYGTSKGWRRDQLRVSNGFNVVGIGLDIAVRGIKLDDVRPDLIIVDDIDNRNDTEGAIKKKIDALTSSIFPAGASDVSILFVQNLIHEDSIVAQLVDGRADFLHDRKSFLEVAVRNLKTEEEILPNGVKSRKIISGEPTWPGQDLETCQAQIRLWGWSAFVREAQQEVQGANGFYFDHEQFTTIQSLPTDKTLRLVRAWDMAATQGGGDWTVGVLLGFAPNWNCYVLDVVRHQFDTSRVRDLILRTAERDTKGEVWTEDEYDVRGNLMKAGEFFYSFTDCKVAPVIIHLPVDPGQAGIDQIEQLKALLKRYVVRESPVTKRKAVRARGWADKVNNGGVYLIAAPWNYKYIQEHRQFKEDESHANDDQVDPSADGFNIMVAPTQNLALTPAQRVGSIKRA